MKPNPTRTGDCRRLRCRRPPCEQTSWFQSATQPAPSLRSLPIPLASQVGCGAGWYQERGWYQLHLAIDTNHSGQKQKTITSHSSITYRIQLRRHHRRSRYRSRTASVMEYSDRCRTETAQNCRMVACNLPDSFIKYIASTFY